MNTKATYEWRRGNAWICVLPNGPKWACQVKDSFEDTEFRAVFKTRNEALEFAHIHMRGSR